MQNQLEKQLKNGTTEIFNSVKHLGKIKTDSVRLDVENKIIHVHLSPAFTHLPVRSQLLNEIGEQYMKYAGEQFEDYTLQFYSRGLKAENFIPPLFKDANSALNPNPETLNLPDTARVVAPKCKYPVVQRETWFPNGLSGRHIALWHSHGLYYEPKLDRWEWQRARMFQTVEDMFSQSFVIPFLTPMLENAGATVLIPKERDVQHREVIVDGANSNSGNSEIIVVNDGINRWQTAAKGFAPKDTLFDHENPFTAGSHYKIQSAPATNARLIYVPDIPERGDFAIYVSWFEYADAIEEVDCLVSYSGGTDRFKLNQQMGAGTWIYLGTYHFAKGKNYYEGRIEISAKNRRTGTISIDAVRLGGGMGNVARRSDEYMLNHPLLVSTADTARLSNPAGWQLSGKARFMEGARYYLQYAGMPDTLVYTLSNGRNDYTDDYTSRGEWVNYLMRKPNAVDSVPAKGLGIPIDMALALHTDAGVTPTDSVIGTLAVYSAERNEGVFPDGTSKLKSRDLADIVQTQIVDDIRHLYNENWTRRAIWDKQYSEAWRPNTPALLLELLSHQNMADMRYGLNPQFRFDVSRAIYKGIVRFFEGDAAIIQPLPPSHLVIERKKGKTVRIAWKPVTDQLEPSAEAKGYMVYLRKENQGFNGGIFCAETEFELELDEWQTCYDIKVTAINDGGESFPSETLSTALFPTSRPAVLIVNGFTRIGAPSFFAADSACTGISWWNDQGVPAGTDYSTTGFQYHFDRRSVWLDDDSPGWGASYSDMEGKGIRGNTFDFTAIHGKAFRNAGYSFVSVSKKAFTDKRFDASDYSVIDIIFGEERGTPDFKHPAEIKYRIFTEEMMNAIERYAKTGGNILISGAYIGTDGVENKDEEAIAFAKKMLGFVWRTNHADNRGEVKATHEAALLFPARIDFNTGYHPDFYTVESPDAIEPEGAGSVRIFRYAGNGTGAGVVFNGKKHRAVSLGFPIETIINNKQLNELIKKVMIFFENKNVE